MFLFYLIIIFFFFVLYRVNNLIEGHDYNFRVKAVNKEGESTPLKGDYPVTAKDPFGKPGQPGQPQPVGMYTHTR